jgi:hypothetical protein
MAYDKEYYENAQYNGYDRVRDSRRKMARQLYEYFQPDSYLSVGCAKAFDVEQLIELGVDAYGFDISSYMVNESVVKDKLKVADAMQKFPYDREFSVVYSSDVLEHLDDKGIDNCLAECQRLTNDKIVHVISTHFDKDYGDASKLDGVDDTHISMYSPQWWFNKIKEHTTKGWMITKIFCNDYIVCDGEKFNTTIFVISKDRWINLQF